MVSRQIQERLNLVERVIRIPHLALADLSPDNSTLLLSTNISGSYQLATLPATGRGLKQITFGQERVVYTDISNRSELVAFSRDFQGREQHQIFIVPLSGGEETQLGKLDSVRVFDFSWSPDDGELAFAGSTREANAVWVMDSSTARTREVFRNKHWVSGPKYYKKDAALCFNARTTDHPSAAEIVFLEDGKPKIYTPQAGSENTDSKWHPTEKKILFRTDVKGRFDLAIYNMERDELTFLKAGELGLGLDFPHYDWMPDRNSVYYLAAKEGRTKLYIEDLKSGSINEVAIPVGRHSNIEVSKDGQKIFYSYSSLSTPPSVGRHDRTERRNITLYTVLEYAGDIPLGSAHHETYTSFDGLTIHGFYIKPKDIGDEKRPCVIWPHGGPAWEVADEWSAPIQALVVAGFPVFAPNFRGSTGYGAEFEKMNLRDVGGADLKDVVEAMEHASKKKEVNPEKIAIAGASYGGFMTFLCMTKVPDLWAAGAAIVGVTDWKEMYELSDAAFRSFIEKYLGKPEENPQLYYEASAMNFVHQIKAPILIWHRGNDSRCPLQPVEKFANKLKELGKKHEFTVVWDEGHGPQKTDNLARQYRALADFLIRTLEQ